MILAVLAIVLIAAGGVLLFWLNRRHLRQKIANMETEMALEKTKRKITASTLTIQEMDNLLGVLRDELSEIRGEGALAKLLPAPGIHHKNALVGKKSRQRCSQICLTW